MSTSEALSGVGEASAEVADEIDVSKRGRSASLVKRARWAWRYVSIRAVTALDMVLTACTFGVLGRDRVRRWSRRLSLVSASGVPPTPADVIGNYLRVKLSLVSRTRPRGLSVGGPGPTVRSSCRRVPRCQSAFVAYSGSAI